MPTLCVAFPVKPGKAPAVKDFLKETTGPRRREFEASERRLGISKEAWFLQGSPQGDLALVYLEAKDLLKAWVDFGRSQDPFDLWFKEEVKAYTGVDFSQPPPGPLPEQVLAFGYER